MPPFRNPTRARWRERWNAVPDRVVCHSQPLQLLFIFVFKALLSRLMSGTSLAHMIQWSIGLYALSFVAYACESHLLWIHISLRDSLFVWCVFRHLALPMVCVVFLSLVCLRLIPESLLTHFYLIWGESVVVLFSLIRKAGGIRGCGLSPVGSFYVVLGPCMVALCRG